MKRPANCGLALLTALAIVVAVGAAAHDSVPYLPLTGPPPLRMLTLRKPPATPIIKAETPAVAAAASAIKPGDSARPPASPPATGDASFFTNFTNFVAGDEPDANLATRPTDDGVADKSKEDAFIPSVFTLPTPDLLGITPQMLATYFHPVQFERNPAAPAGPWHVEFMPPLPPDKSSHAKYLVK